MATNTSSLTIERQKTQAAAWFRQLRDDICAEFEQIEQALETGEHASLAAGTFERKVWDKSSLPAPSHPEFLAPLVARKNSQQEESNKNEASRPNEPSAAEGAPSASDNMSRSGGNLMGGGEISLMRGGRVFEKVGVNISLVHGEFSEKFRKEMPHAQDDPRFWASGISLVAHMRSPHVPAVHMNTRMIVLGGEGNYSAPHSNNNGGIKASKQQSEHAHTSDRVSRSGAKTSPQKTHFGGGADLTPMRENPEDTAKWHAAFKECCDQFNPDYYPKYKKWCDEYFHLPHRHEPRGIGGIFYDYLRNDWQENFSFTKSVGRCFLDIYPQLVREHMHTSWTAAEREYQLHRRGRYAEFNLLHDRGTRFGLMTGGNTEAILMSMPPEAKW